MEVADERYKRGKIYTIRCRYDNNLIYVGSTIAGLSKRIGQHRADNNCSLYKYVNGDWANWYIELYEDFPCNNKQELNKREGEVIRQIATINRCIAGRTNKDYVLENKEQIKEQRKQYYQNNRDYLLEQKKNHRLENIDKYKEVEKAKEERRKEKIKCDVCGCELTIGCLKRHQRTLKCLNAKKNNTE
jgi:hypothetical protein